jgi:transcriptional regulator with XRE-family HTH domain
VNKRLLEARIRAGLSRAELAERVGISEKQIGLIERGLVKFPREEAANAIAREVEVDLFDLFPIEGHPAMRRRIAS